MTPSDVAARTKWVVTQNGAGFTMAVAEMARQFWEAMASGRMQSPTNCAMLALKVFDGAYTLKVRGEKERVVQTVDAIKPKKRRKAERKGKRV